ncbi:fructose-bisphosphate aldolase class I [Candidatus Nomurabacteria bacterium]|nr:fructose-bisphosphate aldolase class I [Candidatus Nomurabacteria bacterium]
MKKNTKLYETAAALLASGKGILAADESDPTAGKRLAMVHLPNEPEHRQLFREILFTANDIEKYISGVIMYDSSIRNTTRDGIPFADVLTAKGIIPGIKVDLGTTELQGFKGEVVTQGLDNLAERFEEYYDMGARFAKWRMVVNIDEDETPTDAAIKINAVMLARYAQLAQEANIVPIVEPEVIHAGDHSLQKAEMVTTRTLQILFQTLMEYKVDLGGLILKSSMVLAGSDHPEQTSPEEVAQATLRTFHMSVPHECAGIVFLSGGQTPERSTDNLNAIAKMGDQPWPITFSFSRALEEPVLQAWGGKEENIEAAKNALTEVSKKNSAASLGQL